MPRENRFSLSRAACALMNHSTLSGVEAEISAQLERELTPKFKERIGGVGPLIPSSAFNPPGVQRRDLTTTTAPGLIGIRVERLPGVLAWSAVVRSGVTVLGPFTADNLRIYFEEAWPSATWTAEGSAVVPADMTLTSATLTPHRICSQIVVSKQLLIQAAGTPSFDLYLAQKMGIALSSMVDQAVLYGAGASSSQPLGVIDTTGTTAITVGVPPVWADLEALRLAATNQNADLDSFGYITNQTVRKSLATTSRFANAGTSIWDAVAGESEVSLEVSDSRIFAGCWAYATICYWGVGENGPAIDLVVDPYSRAQASEVILTSTAYIDCCTRWPQVMAYSQAGVAS